MGRDLVIRRYCITEGTEDTGCATNSVMLIRDIRTLARRRRELHLLFYSKSHLYRSTPDASVVLISPEITNTCLYATDLTRNTVFDANRVLQSRVMTRGKRRKAHGALIRGVLILQNYE